MARLARCGSGRCRRLAGDAAQHGRHRPGFVRLGEGAQQLGVLLRATTHDRAKAQSASMSSSWAKRSAGVRVADVAELVNKLKNEAKVI